ncbi:hypothetical protein L484_026288 [Morus notabilis]|uniref:Uncharacterized protein n=1 Tax=Morus notabilis TaxID=981085 RepID=W9R6D4_9ROSA|nr:uncharacterized protein LOC21408951 [Morus notabilis]EXB74591.1 hypothetical protein L484_026288 [Morus notabilis]
MDDSHHSVSTSPSIKRSNDENEQNYQQIGANLRNLRKPMAKNYMLPTICAASKAITPRKILAERNEALEPSSFDTNVQKISNFEKSNDCLCQTEPKSPSVSQCHGDEKEADLSSKSYDPLTNYLSPRPQFLRYNPNRRREIFRGQEDGTGEEVDGIVSGSGSFDSLRGSFDESASDTNCGSSISGGGSPAQEGKEIEGANEEMEESDEEEIEEEEEEKKCCNLKGVFKTLLLLAVFVLSTMFISSLNSSVPLSDGYCKVQNHTFETDFVKNLESRDYFSHQREGRQKGLMELNNNLESNFLMEEENLRVTEGVEEENLKEIKRTDELKEAVSLESGEVDDVEVDETDDLGGEIVAPQIEEVFTHMVETIEKVEFSEDYQTPNSSEHHDSCFYTSSSSRIEVNPDEEVHNQEVGNFEIVEIGMLERILKQMNTEFSFKVLTGVLSISTTIASLLLCIRLRPKKTMKNDSSEPVLVKQEKVSGKDSSSLLSQPYIQERRRSVLPTREDENIDEVYSFGKNPSPSINSIEKDPDDGEYSESRAPTVEFLGEFVVREIRSSGKKGITKGSEEESLSNYSVSSAKKIGGKSHSVSVQAHQAHSEFSIVDSPSYGSYTAEKETVKEVVSTTPTRLSSRKGEVMAITPVRRSSRIRNLMSP